MVMAEGGYGGSGFLPVGFSDCISRRAHGSLRQFARPLSTRAMNPRASRRNICPQKHKQDSHDYIAGRPCDVRRLRPALPLLVRLQGHVAHDVPLTLLAIYRRYGSTMLPNAGCVLGTDLNCSESLGMPPPMSGDPSL